MSITIVSHPKAYGGYIDFKRNNNKQKAFVRLGENNGHYWLQFHEASGILASYIHERGNGYYTEDGIKMPKYVYNLIKVAEKYLNQLVGRK